MEYSEDHIALAAEYALGTLDADERAQVETMMAVDPEFTAIVQAWEFRLGVLNQMVGSVEPRAELWERIRTAIGHCRRTAGAARAAGGAADWPAAGPAAEYDDLFAPRRLRRPRRRLSTIPTWSGCRAGAGAIAISRWR